MSSCDTTFCPARPKVDTRRRGVGVGRIHKSKMSVITKPVTIGDYDLPPISMSDSQMAYTMRLSLRKYFPIDFPPWSAPTACLLSKEAEKSFKEMLASAAISKEVTGDGDWTDEDKVNEYLVSAVGGSVYNAAMVFRAMAIELALRRAAEEKANRTAEAKRIKRNAAARAKRAAKKI